MYLGQIYLQQNISRNHINKEAHVCDIGLYSQKLPIHNNLDLKYTGKTHQTTPRR